MCICIPLQQADYIYLDSLLGRIAFAGYQNRRYCMANICRNNRQNNDSRQDRKCCETRHADCVLTFHVLFL
jgi:hypothetical protein